MDPMIHTLIATGLVAAAYYIGRLLGIRKAYFVGKIDGAEDLIFLLDQEGTYKRENIVAAVARWTENTLEGKYDE
jgi:hypothetical protein